MPRQYRPGDNVLFQQLDQEVVLLNLSSGIYYGASDVGARIWKMATDGKSREEMVAELVREYKTTLEQATADLDAFLADLQRHELLSQHDA